MNFLNVEFLPTYIGQDIFPFEKGHGRSDLGDTFQMKNADNYERYQIIFRIFRAVADLANLRSFIS